jgi:calcineurin-like phosphoesterase family protein
MPRTFLISDNHFGSNEVIKYFGRVYPGTKISFEDANKMDAFMIDVWNRTVESDDTVFSIGDFTWAGDWKSPERYWWQAPDTYQDYLDKLNGHKVLVHGNHDPWNEDPWNMGGNILHYKGRMFYLTHDPTFVPKNWKDWVIHGHHHKMPDRPFIDGKNKNINVACELVNYTPVDIDWILSLDLETIERRRDTINKVPIRK